MTRMRYVAFVAEGNSDIPGGAFSGTAFELVRGLRAAGHRVQTIDAELYGWRKGLTALRSYAPARARWRASYRFGETAFRARSRVAELAFQALEPAPDLLFQIGATFSPPPAYHKPLVLYCDWNMASAMRAASTGFAPAVDNSAAAEIDARETAVYRRAELILTISERLRESFIEDYGIPENRVVAAYAGSNTALPLSDAEVDMQRAMPRPPTLLFSAKEFHRKGGETVRTVFLELRRRFPDLVLITMGFPGRMCEGPGIRNLGILNKADARDRHVLTQAFIDADVFLLPTRYDPFPTVIREAMQFGLPCVTSNVWALGEMVHDGVTGYVMDPLDIDGFVDATTKLLESREIRLRMGTAARERFRSLFSWTAVNGRINHAIAQLDW
jgi:glycosyltransferase involved in cell wall biosynthesis